MLRLPGLILIALLPSVALGQVRGRGVAARQTPDSVFARALALNNDQRGAAARALIDSLLRATQPTAAAYADALFWRGAFADSEQVAEESYLSIVREFPLHRRAEESLIRLAQLEMSRGNRSQSQRYLDRIIVEHPYGQQRARASYWRARLFFEENELERACAELGLARARVAAAEVELKNEIEYAARRCANVPVPSQTTQQKAGAPPASGKGAGDSSGKAAGATTKAAADTTSKGKAAGATTKAAADTTSKVAAATTKASAGTTGKGAAGTTTKAAATTSNAAATRERYSAQAAAFPARENAQAFVDALKARGYDARLVAGSPFRVRIGFFETREQAAALVAELKEKRVSEGAFVVVAEPRE